MEHYLIEVNGKTLSVRVLERSGSQLTFEIDGNRYTTNTARAIARRTAPGRSKMKRAVRSATGEITAPMPGIVVSIAVAQGETVAVGQVLLVIEAMKMENNIIADRAGVISEILVAEGQETQAGDPLVRID